MVIVRRQIYTLRWTLLPLFCWFAGKVFFSNLKENGSTNKNSNKKLYETMQKPNLFPQTYLNEYRSPFRCNIWWRSPRNCCCEKILGKFDHLLGKVEAVAKNMKLAWKKNFFGEFTKLQDFLQESHLQPDRNYSPFTWITCRKPFFLWFENINLKASLFSRFTHPLIVVIFPVCRA